MFVQINKESSSIRNDKECYLKDDVIWSMEEFKKNQFIVAVNTEYRDFAYIIDRKARMIRSCIKNP